MKKSTFKIWTHLLYRTDYYLGLCFGLPSVGSFGGINLLWLFQLAFCNGVFGLRNVVHHLLSPHFFVWFVEWSELIYHHLIHNS
jgi:hypothetical protein